MSPIIIGSLQMRYKWPVSLGFIQVAMAVLGVVISIFVWTLYFQQSSQTREERLAAKAGEHLNLAIIVAENLKQITDRARAISNLVSSGDTELTGSTSNLSRLLASDPVFNPLALYSASGEQVYASHTPNAEALAENWISQVLERHRVPAPMPFIPLLEPAEEIASPFPVWRLPFLLPLVSDSDGALEHVVLIELDIGYLASLYQHIELGRTGFIQLLDGAGHERMRADSSGVIFNGAPLLPRLPSAASDVRGGVYVAVSGGAVYQSAYHRMPTLGFSVVINQQHAEILAPVEADMARQLLLNLLMTLGLVVGIFWITRMLRIQNASLAALEQSQQENLQLIARLETEHERSSRAASTDHLSGLNNRRQFTKIATRVLAEQRVKRRLMAILFIDLDRFKTINDTLGHGVGDLLLQAVAGRITRLLGPEDQTARFGGDEFVILLAGDRTEQQIDAWVQGLTQRLSSTYELEGRELNTSPSIGISICPRDGQDIDRLIRHADAAMYSAKRAGRGQYRFFDRSLNVADVEEFHLEQALGDALRGHQFVLHYQPLIRLDTMTIESYEALLRWQHPDFGMLYPDRFIPLAERSGFIIPLGMEVISLACQQLAQWRDEGKITKLSVNVSALQLNEPRFSERVLAELEKYAIDPQFLELEITETAILERHDMAIESLQQLRAVGMDISLDDFGKGYAGFAHLQALPITKLKIDRSLIAEITNSHDDSLIVSSTITLAKRLSLQVVAEGVETREQVVYLKLAGCDIAQGYHFSRPISADAIAKFDSRFTAARVSA